MAQDTSNSTNGDRGTVQTVLVELGKLIEPLKITVDALQTGNVQPLLTLLEDMGLDEGVLGDDIEAIVTQLEGAAEALGVLDEAVLTPIEEDSTPDLSRGDDIFQAIKTVFDTVKGLNDLDLGDVEVDVDVEEIGERFSEYLIITYLHNEHAQAYDLLRILGLIDDTVEPADLDLSAIETAAQEPTKLPAELFGWGTDDLKADELLDLIGQFLASRGYRVGYDEGSRFDFSPDPDILQGGSVSGSGVVSTPSGLRLPITHQPINFGLDLIELPPENDKPAGLGLRPYGNVNYGETTELGEDWQLTAKASAETTDEWGVGVRPDQETMAPKPVLLPETGSPGLDIHAEGLLEYLTGSESGSVIVGDPEATRLLLQSFSIGAIAEGSTDEFEFRGELPTSLRLVIQPEGGFVSEFIPEGINSEFDMTVGWSSESGVYFQGSGSIEAAIQLNESIGPVTLREVFLSIGIEPETPAFPITVAASAEGELGPFSVTVKRIGLEARVAFPSDGGNAGPMEFEIGFKPPNGLGVDIGAGPVSGGGYIEHEPEKNRYAGTLQLEFGEYAISAVGLLKTELPGGRDGYSFLLLITAELPRIDLGFGFTLNGVGGLLGVHRGMNKKPLAEAVRAGNIDAVLFPENVVENAQRIVSDLRSIFPPKADHHVVGPMAKFGWGSPTLLTMDIGIVLGIPSWKITLLGKIQLVLPDEDAAIIELNLAVLGFLDIPNERLEMTASLYDSRIAMFAVKGDMALQSSWGDEPSFMMSIGGFHPLYEPPKSFPDLDRVQAWIPGLGDNLRVRMSGYLAVTPNTFQVGTHTLIHAEAGPAKVKGEWGWDALFQFDPFKFRIDFHAAFAVKLWGHGLSLEIDGTLQGPRPLEVSGTVTIDISMVPKVEASLDVSIGSAPDDRELPDTKVFEKLIGEIERPQNWQAQLPEDGAQFVTIRRPEAEEDSAEASGGSDRILTHPLGGIAVRQTVVPLEYKIETFGETSPAGFDKFRIGSVTVVDSAGDETEIGPADGGGLVEKFAKSKYRAQLSEEKKLSGNAFINGLAGHRSGSDQFHWPDEGHCTTASLSYETLITDEREQNFAAGLIEMGNYREQHPETARLGLSERTASKAIQLSAVGRGDPSTDGFLREDRTRVGLPTLEEEDDEDQGVVASEVIR